MSEMYHDVSSKMTQITWKFWSFPSNIISLLNN